MDRVEGFFLSSAPPGAIQDTLLFRGPEGEVAVEVLRLRPREVDELASQLKAARDRHLLPLPARQIAEALGATARRWLDPKDPYRKRAEVLIPRITGYSSPMVKEGIDRIFRPLLTEGLLKLLRQELGDPEVLDRFVSRGDGRRRRALGPRLITHIFSGNIPGLPIWSLAFGLLVKAANLGKMASEEPLLAALFVRSLAEDFPEVASTLAVLWWKGGEDPVEEQALAAAEVVVAYGGELSLKALRQKVPPEKPFVGYGHRVSFGILGREALRRSALTDLALRAAYDATVYDQQGCVSPHVFYVEEGGEASPLEFAEALARAMGEWARRLPRGPIRAEAASAVHQLRALHQMKETVGETVKVFASPEGTHWTVLYQEGPAFTPSCLNRTLFVLGVKSWEEALPHLPPFSPYLQTAALEMAPQRKEEVAEALAALGVCRICPLGSMPWPPLDWCHDGQPNLLPLLRWAEIEEGAP